MFKIRVWLIRHRLRVLVHRVRFPGQPMFSPDAAEDLIGRRIIVGITQQDHAHSPPAQDQYYGRIVRMNLEEGIVIQTPSGDERKLPPDLRSVVGAPRGEYRFRSTGETVADPDLQTSWTQTLPALNTSEAEQCSHATSLSTPDLSWMVGRRIAAIRLVEPISWWFDVAGGGTFRADTLWRLIVQGRVQASSADHGQVFGLAKPIDSAARANEALLNSVVTQASFRPDTGDVVIGFDSDATLEILTASSGHEGWSICFPNGDEAIGLGGGRIEFRRRDG
jgi:hypothetical protein